MNSKYNIYHRLTIKKVECSCRAVMASANNDDVVASKLADSTTIDVDDAYDVIEELILD